MSSKLRDILNNLVDKTYGLHSVQIKEVPKAEKAIIALISDRERLARIEERNMVALDNYHGHTFSDSTNWKGKYDKFIRNNERRIATLRKQQSGKEQTDE